MLKLPLAQYVTTMKTPLVSLSDTKGWERVFTLYLKLFLGWNFPGTRSHRPFFEKKEPKVLFPGVPPFWGSKFVFQYPVAYFGNFGVYLYVFRHDKSIAIIFKNPKWLPCARKFKMTAKMTLFDQMRMWHCILPVIVIEVSIFTFLGTKNTFFKIQNGRHIQENPKWPPKWHIIWPKYSYDIIHHQLFELKCMRVSFYTSWHV